jgi:galactokinase
VDVEYGQENVRVQDSISALAAGDLEAVGRLWAASHASLRDDFEVTNKELNDIVECACGTDGCYGARMTGAGFGGCAVALVAADKAEAFSEEVAGQYKRITGLTPALYVTQATQGASVVGVD